MGDRAAAVVAAAAWAGALWAAPVPWWTGAGICLTALVVRRPWLLGIGVLVLAGALASTARAGLDGLAPGPVHREVTLLTDPERFDDEVRVEVRLGRRHLEAWAHGSAAADIEVRLAGERLTVDGRVEPFETRSARHVSRHLAGRLEVSRVRDWRAGALPTRFANRYRRWLTAGSVSLGPDQRSLLAGLVLGDDRAQSPALVDAFRGSGLTHLLAVSGQNVAFVLLLVEPILRRVPQTGRVAVVVVVLALFGVVTRFEPSVLRATVMAGVAVASTAVGQPARGLRALALAVTVLLLADPLLVHSIGFTLSVAASLGIVLWAERLAAATALPPGLARPLGVVLAAQLAVAPVLVATFGPLPVASLPANLLAGPAAGPAMVWGMTAGVVAGLAPDAAPLIHLPTRILLGWIELIARLGAAAPLGGLSSPALAAVVVGAAGRRLAGRRRAVAAAALGVALAGVALPVAGAVLAPAPVRQPLAGAVVWRAGDSALLIVHDRVRAVTLLGELREARVRRLDLIAAAAALDDEVVRALRDRFGPVPLLAAAGPGPRLPVGPPGTRVPVGALDLVVLVGGARPVFDVEVRSPGALGARAPPLRRDPPGAGDGDPQPDA